MPQDPRQAGYMLGIEPKMSCLERQLILKNPHKFKIEREEKINKNRRF